MIFFLQLKIDYFNNAIICELIEQNHKGILSIIDEGCRNIGKVTDEVCSLHVLRDDFIIYHVPLKWILSTFYTKYFINVSIINFCTR